MNESADVPLPVLVRELLDESRRLELAFDYASNTWVLEKDSMRFLVATLRRTRPRRVIEFGSGISSRFIVSELGETGVLRSFDHVGSYAEATRGALAPLAGRRDVQVLDRKISFGCHRGKLLPFYGIRGTDLDAVNEADLVFVDGPPGTWGREAALYVAFPAMRPGALLLLDDARRPGEQRVAQAWRRFFGDAVEFEYLPELGKGLLVARKAGVAPRGRSFSIAEKLESARLAARSLWRHRPRLRSPGTADG